MATAEELRQGMSVYDCRYGETVILAVTEKRVWFERLLPSRDWPRIYHTSKRRAEEFLSDGPQWADQNRWTLRESTAPA